ncbi:MAG: hypothetical protein M1391_03580 [Bacteroidetes bacterium]|nr:hypothetical protein [Bacteroidota bacterium]
MKRNKIILKILSFAAVTLLVAVVSGCSSGKEMTSSWQQEQIQMKGDLSFWRNKVFEIPDKKFGVGFANDDKFMYVCLTTDDRSKIFQMFRNGFIVWLEPVSGDNKTFGIKYPLVNIMDKQPQMDESTREEMSAQNNQRSFGRMLENQNEFEIVNQDKYPLLALPLVNREGIEAKLSFLDGRLVYELKVPLVVSKQYSIAAGALPGEKIRVRFETLVMNADKRGQRTSGFEPSGNGERSPEGGEGEMPRGGARSGRRGEGGMRPGMGRSGMSEPINYTVDLLLEKAPTTK